MVEFFVFSIFLIGISTIGVCLYKLIIFILKKLGIQIKREKKEI